MIKFGHHGKPKSFGWGLKGNACAALITVMLLMWGRLLLKEVPRVSSADPIPIQQPTAPQPATELTEENQAVVDISGITPLSRDLFDFDPSPYNRTQLPDFPNEQLRPEPESPDSEADVALLRKQVNRLQLQSLMGGNPPVVMIDGRVLTTGDSVNGFQISAIDFSQGTVDFTQDGHTFRLKP